MNSSHNQALLDACCELAPDCLGGDFDLEELDHVVESPGSL